MDEADAGRQAEEARRQAAVRHPRGRQLIIAGPGGGKTEVPVARTVWLIREHGVAPAQIRLVAFTRRAVGEFTERLYRQLGDHLPHVSTVHAAAVRVLRDHGAEWLTGRGLTPSFQFPGEAAELGAFTRALQRHPELCRELPAGRDAADLFKALQYERLHRGDGKPGPGSRLLPAYRSYMSWLRSQNAVDLVGLVPLAAALLEAEPKVRERVQVRYLLVDEAQDLNLAQRRFLRLLANAEQNLTFVGDPYQAIFSWQGADPRLFDRLVREEPGWSVVTLQANYRSTAAILRASAAVLPPPDPARPRQFPTRGEGEPVRVIPSSSRDVEAKRVANWLEEQERAGVPWSQMAVLADTHAELGRVEEALLLRGIPYQAARSSFFDRPGVAEPLTYLRYLGGDPAALGALLRFPPRGISPEDLAVLEQLARERGEAPRTLLAEAEHLPLPRVVRLGLASVHRVLLRLERSVGGAGREGADLDHLLSRTLRETGLEAWSAHLPGRPGREHHIGRNVELLRQLVTKRFPGRGEQPLRALVQLAQSVRAPDPLALEGELGYSAFAPGSSESNPAADTSAEPSGVQLLTLHQAKGLQFDAVAIVGCEWFAPGRLRRWAQGRSGTGSGTGVRRSVEPAIARSEEWLDSGDSPYENDLRPANVADVQEEQRLFYVGMTRARDRLALFASRGSAESIIPGSSHDRGNPT